MKINFKIRFLLGIILVAATMSLSACNNGPATLSFEIVNQQTGYISSNTTPSYIEIITSPQMKSIWPLSPEDQVAIQSIDYSRYFTLIVTFAHGYDDQDSITKISQFKDVIWVQTNLVTSSSSEGDSSYQIVKIPKTDVIRYGKITFRLVDDGFAEIAKVVQTIPAPQSEPAATIRPDVNHFLS
jgi:hypothetical protein